MSGASIPRNPLCSASHIPQVLGGHGAGKEGEQHHPYWLRVREWGTAGRTLGKVCKASGAWCSWRSPLWGNSGMDCRTFQALNIPMCYSLWQYGKCWDTHGRYQCQRPFLLCLLSPRALLCLQSAGCSGHGDYVIGFEKNGTQLIPQTKISCEGSSEHMHPFPGG